AAPARPTRARTSTSTASASRCGATGSEGWVFGMNPTTIPGLTSAEVAERTRKGLVNRTRSSAWADYAAIASRHLFTLFNFIVVPAAVALFYHNEWQAGISVTGTALINTVIGLFQEVRAKRQLDKLAILNESKIRVVRDGHVSEIAASDVVL